MSFVIASAMAATALAQPKPYVRASTPVDTSTDSLLVAASAPITSKILKNSDGTEAPRTTEQILTPQVFRLAGVNSDDRDNTPLVTADGNVMFFNSTRVGAARTWAQFNETKQRYDDDIYFAMRQPSEGGEEKWGEPVNIGMELNSGADDGVMAISPDGLTLYFSSLKKGWDKDGGPFYRAKLSGMSWCDIQGLGGGITDFFRTREPGRPYRVYGGSISSDGREFYFATTIHSPTGKHQIWVSRWNGRDWGYPVNLGPNVNGEHASYAPCIAADGKTLYFTTAGQFGYGGDDIFVSVNKDGVWGKPFNVGAPLNTAGDDAFISIAASGEKAYLSRTISGNEDIYVAPIPVISRPSSVVLLSGVVSDKESNKVLEATIVIEDLTTGEKIFNASSHSLTGAYTTVLRPGHDYGISISAPGYVFHSARYTIPTNVAYDKMTHDFQLHKLQEGEKFVANNIFFDYNTATLSPESRPELDRIVEMMREHPQARIAIDGHTDNVGGHEYNMQLSFKRAESVRDYLLTSGGIDSSRIETKGFGYTKPVATNKNEEGRRQNRRSEFTILKL